MSFIHTLVLGTILSSSAYAAPTLFEAWQGFSSPEILGSGFNPNFRSLPTSGSTYYDGPRFWSAHYWPSKEGGINNRWNNRSRVGFNYASPARQELLRMSANQIAALAPSEKYDIFMGRYDYPLKAEVARTVSPRADEWEGICHGWVVATLNHNEPAPKTLTNRDGIAVPFGAADIKALLSYYYANEEYTPAPTVGLRCNFGTWTGGQRECDQDLNAGAFHIIITNKLGLRHEGIIMDVDRLKEVWNQPVISYTSRVLGEFGPSRTAARQAVRELRIATEIFYIDETDPSWNPTHGTSLQKMDSKNFVYRVELDYQGNIVGGTWESEQRPDFIWQKAGARSFVGNLSGLSYLVSDRMAPTETPAPRYPEYETDTTPVPEYEEEHRPTHYRPGRYEEDPRTQPRPGTTRPTPWTPRRY